MVKTLWAVLAVAVAVAAGVTEPLSAQDSAGRAQRERPGRVNDPTLVGELRPGDVMRVLDGYAVVQAQEALQLNDAQYAPFVTRLKKLQETRRLSQQGRHRILQELRKLAGPQAAPADETTIRQQIKALREHDDRSAAEIRKAYDTLDEVLDAKQQARFRLFEERLELRKMDLLMRARQGAARRDNR